MGSPRRRAVLILIVESSRRSPSDEMGRAWSQAIITVIIYNVVTYCCIGGEWPLDWKGSIKSDGKYHYSDDLKSWDRCDNERGTPPLPPECTRINYEKQFESHPDREFADYVINGVKNGFRIGHDQEKRKSATTNLLSAMVHQEVVAKYLEGEIQVARLVGPFRQGSLPQVHCSPFGVIPKKGQDCWRLIDLSSPRGSSINDGIKEDLASIVYVSVLYSQP